MATDPAMNVNGVHDAQERRWREMALQVAADIKETLPPHIANSERPEKAVEFVLAGAVSINADGNPVVVSRRNTYTLVEGECRCEDSQRHTRFCRHAIAASIYADAMRLLTEEGEHDELETPEGEGQPQRDEAVSTTVSTSHASASHDEQMAALLQAVLAEVQGLREVVGVLQTGADQLAEAPVSICFKKSQRDGQEILCTLRGDKFLEVLDACPTAIAWLEAIEYASKKSPQASSSGSAPPQAQAEEQGEDTRSCPLHSAPMRRFGKEGRTWYSHQLDDGTWCKGKRPRAA